MAMCILSIKDTCLFTGCRHYVMMVGIEIENSHGFYARHVSSHLNVYGYQVVDREEASAAESAPRTKQKQIPLASLY
jgi:hypothetical protein